MLPVISDHTPESRVISWEHWSALGPGSLLGEKDKERGPPRRKERTEWEIEGRSGRRPLVRLRFFAPGIRHFYPPMSLVSANT